MERVLQYVAKPGSLPIDVTVRISEPRKVGEDWSVTLELEGFREAHRTEHHGVDSLSAVLAAARVAPVVLESIAGPGTLTWLGEPDLGFPFLPLAP